MHIAFVILHYITIDDTCECIDSIEKNIEYDNYSIIIVDNNSSNGTGEEIKERYKEDKKVDVILNNRNLGFAKGNNIGFKYAKENKKADFIVLINNDTIINQKDFCNILISEFDKQKYYILGPNIISTKDGGNQNPIKYKINSKRDFEITIVKHSIQLFLNYIKLEEPLTKIKKKILSRNKSIKEKGINNSDEMVLHGSCLIFSKLYINRFNGLYNNTYMYGEEDILFYLCKQMNLKYLYCNKLTIMHKEAAATENTISNKSNKKKRFFYKNKIISCINFISDLSKCKNIDELLL